MSVTRVTGYQIGKQDNYLSHFFPSCNQWNPEINKKKVQNSNVKFIKNTGHAQKKKKRRKRNLQ